MSNEGPAPEPEQQQTTTPPSPALSAKLAPSEQSEASDSQAFNPGWRFYVAFASLAVITLMAALDATSLSVALPVSHFPNRAKHCPTKRDEGTETLAAKANKNSLLVQPCQETLPNPEMGAISLTFFSTIRSWRERCTGRLLRLSGPAPASC